MFAVLPEWKRQGTCKHLTINDELTINKYHSSHREFQVHRLQAAKILPTAPAPARTVSPHIPPGAWAPQHWNFSWNSRVVMGACEPTVTERGNYHEIRHHVKLSRCFHTLMERCFRVNAVLSGLLSAPLCAWVSTRISCSPFMDLTHWLCAGP